MASFRLRFQGHGGASPPDPGDYPQGVIDLGLEAVYDLKTTAGPTSAYTQTLAPGNVPAGYTLSSPQLLSPTSGSTTVANWWLKDAEVTIRGTSIGNLVDCTLTFPGGGRLALADDTSALNMTRCLVDGTGMSGAFASATVMLGGGTSGTIDHCKFINAPIGHFYSFAVSAAVTWSYFGMCGDDPQADTHLELIRNDRGSMDVENCFFDVTDGVIVFPPPDPPLVAGWSGFGFSETNSASGGTITVSFLGCIFLGSMLQSLYCVFQAGAKYAGYNVEITVEGCVIERGTGPIIVVTEAGADVIISGSGNVEPDGTPILSLF